MWQRDNKRCLYQAFCLFCHSLVCDSHDRKWDRETDNGINVSKRDIRRQREIDGQLEREREREIQRDTAREIERNRDIFRA